jgi:hypothetical protein
MPFVEQIVEYSKTSDKRGVTVDFLAVRSTRVLRRGHGMIYPIIYLEGRDKDDRQSIKRTYEIIFERPGGKITGLKRINLIP